MLRLMCFPSAVVCSAVQNIPPSWRHAPDERSWKRWEWSGLGLLCHRGLHGAPWSSTTGAHLVSLTVIQRAWLRRLVARRPGWGTPLGRCWSSVLVRESAKRHAICRLRCRQFDIRCGHFGLKAWRLFLLATQTSHWIHQLFCSGQFGPCTLHTLVVLPVNLETTIFLLQSSPPLRRSPILPQSFSLSHSLPPSPRILQPHHNTVKRRALTDLPPPSFHWPPARQPRFKAAFPLAGSGQVNLRARCDLMPPAFEVSYSSVAHRTQKRCRVAVVKPHP